MGDINVDPERSPAIAEAVDAGLLIDVGHMWAATVEGDVEGEVRKVPEPTFSPKGPAPGMEGPGVSRIDVILANPVAAAAIVGFHLRWDLTQVDHVPIQVDLKVGRLAAMQVIQKTRGLVRTDGVPPEWHVDWDRATGHVLGKYGPDFQSALDKRELDRAHELWNEIAEASIRVAAGDDLDEIDARMKSFPSRGAKLVFTKRPRRKPVDKLGHPTTYRQRQFTNVANKVTDLRHRLKASNGSKGEATMLEEKQVRGGGNIFEIHLWNKINQAARNLLGKHALEALLDLDVTELLDMGALDRLLAELRKQHTQAGCVRRGERADMKRSLSRWDSTMANGHSLSQRWAVGYTPPHVCDRRS